MPLAVASKHDNLSEAINDPDATTRSLWNKLQELHGSSSPAISLRDLIYVGVRDTEAAEDITLAKHEIPEINTTSVRRDGAKHAAKQCLSYLSKVDLIYMRWMWMHLIQPSAKALERLCLADSGPMKPCC